MPGKVTDERLDELIGDMGNSIHFEEERSVFLEVKRLRAEQAQSPAISKAETTEPRKSEDGKFVKLEDGWTCLEHDTLLCMECATPQSWMADAADEIIPEYEGDVIPENDVESIIAKHYASSKEHDLLVRCCRYAKITAWTDATTMEEAHDLGIIDGGGYYHPDILKYAKEWKERTSDKSE